MLTNELKFFNNNNTKKEIKIDWSYNDKPILQIFPLNKIPKIAGKVDRLIHGDIKVDKKGTIQHKPWNKLKILASKKFLMILQNIICFNFASTYCGNFVFHFFSLIKLENLPVKIRKKKKL